MTQWLLSFSMLILLASCSGGSSHGNLYIYQKSVYATNQVSNFEMSHFKDLGYDQVIVVDQFDNKETMKEAKDNCKEMELNCQYIKVGEITKAEKQSIRQAIKGLDKTKIMLISEDRRTTAFFATVYAEEFVTTNPNEINNILYGLKLEQDKQLQRKLNNIK
ncbi:MAG: hypothetical protein HRT44_07240 [Bdellovibrionales bacterium]|nr:hypothetical protein [Bdellovibrionales bacterium]NQZ19031.1 hypothetical protein [Bdellovibrionales bacterium]